MLPGFWELSSTLTAVDEYTERWGFELFPNPGTGLFHMTGLADKSELDVFDMQGRMIFHSCIAGTQTTIDLLRKIRVFTYTDSVIWMGKLPRGK